MHKIVICLDLCVDKYSDGSAFYAFTKKPRNLLEKY